MARGLGQGKRHVAHVDFTEAAAVRGGVDVLQTF